jgi:hypothetical protein
MGEYQFYEFQAVDRPLTELEQANVARLSSRVEMTPTSAVFVYNYRDFPGDPGKILARYYDVMLYLTNWGTRQLMFRLPRTLVKAADLKPYCLEEAISVRTSGKRLILNILVDEEPTGEWVEGTGQLPALLPLRQSLLEGDHRSLYLAWLKCAEVLHYDDKEESAVVEPPVPPNLGKLTPSLRAFIDFLEIDDALVKEAARASSKMPTPKPTEYETLLRKLPAAEREQFLLRLLRGEPNLAHQLQQRLLKFRPARAPAKQTAPSPRRTITKLLEKVEAGYGS